jgi:hypothetical protein
LVGPTASANLRVPPYCGSFAVGVEDVAVDVGTDVDVDVGVEVDEGAVDVDVDMVDGVEEGGVVVVVELEQPLKIGMTIKTTAIMINSPFFIVGFSLLF